mmetsp:Transcript_24707/g.67219  ORF Transcript_24707/g.67219 Transcript_24707/m.67219 type:complete len:326 (-) Transcript_24707:910-1887(-)
MDEAMIMKGSPLEIRFSAGCGEQDVGLFEPGEGKIVRGETCGVRCCEPLSRLCDDKDGPEEERRWDIEQPVAMTSPVFPSSTQGCRYRYAAARAHRAGCTLACASEACGRIQRGRDRPCLAPGHIWRNLASRARKCCGVQALGVSRGHELHLHKARLALPRRLCLCVCARKVGNEAQHGRGVLVPVDAKDQREARWAHGVHRHVQRTCRPRRSGWSPAALTKSAPSRQVRHESPHCVLVVRAIEGHKVRRLASPARGDNDALQPARPSSRKRRVKNGRTHRKASAGPGCLSPCRGGRGGLRATRGRHWVAKVVGGGPRQGGFHEG